MSQTGKLMPNLDQQSTKMLNLTVLQRIDPFIEEILLTAAHVTFYEFNIETNQWSRKDVEGSLFVVKRNTQPRFQFIVMNRRNTENLVENLLGDFEYEVQVPYLLYRNASQEVNGIWFYNPRECDDIANLFSRILNAYAKVPSKPKLSSSKSEFEELEAVPSMSVIEGPLEPSTNAPPAAEAPEESSFENFFSAALNVGKNPSSVTNTPRQTYHPPSSVPLSSHPSNIASFPTPALQVPSVPLSSVPARDTSDPVGGAHKVTNLVKPSSFFSPPSSSSPLITPVPPSLSTVTTINPPLSAQRPYGAPLLQRFPPPTPPLSLAPSSTGFPQISKEKVRDALLMLCQDDQFIDMFHQAMLKAHQS